MSEFYDAMRDASELPDGPERTAILEQAVRIADATGIDDFSYIARDELIQSAVFGGAIEKAIVAFTWCIAQYDAEKPYAVDDSFSLMWSYRWIVSAIASFPSIPRAEIHRMEDDIIRRYRSLGFGTRSLHIRSWSNAIFMGDPERAEASRQQWLETPYDGAIECHACDLQSEIDFAITTEDYARAHKLSESLIKSRSACNRVPLDTFARMLQPLRESGLHDQAEQYASQGAALLGTTSETIGDAGRFIDYHARNGNLDAARKYVESHFGLGMQTTELDLKLDLLLAVETYRNSGGSVAPIARALACGDADVAATIRQKIDHIASLFDARNGNHAQSDFVAKFRARN